MRVRRHSFEGLIVFGSSSIISFVHLEKRHKKFDSPWILPDGEPVASFSTFDEEYVFIMRFP